jgi:hypothetical protein
MTLVTALAGFFIPLEEFGLGGTPVVRLEDLKYAVGVSVVERLRILGVGSLLAKDSCGRR